MRLKRSSSVTDGENSILPMINVVFLLLIFFMIAGALERADLFPIQPPQSEAARDADQEGGILLLSRDGRLAFDGQAVEREALAEVVESFRRAWPEDAVLKVKADASSEALEVVSLLEDLRDAGAGRVVLLATEASGE